MKPLVALSMGDPCGVGPEVVARAWQRPALHAAGQCFVVGHPGILARAVELIGASSRVVEIAAPEDARFRAGEIPCLPVGEDAQLALPPALVHAAGGRAAQDAVVAAARLALEGRIDALVTGPLHKEALAAAGCPFPGHTELLASLCGVPQAAMMLYMPPGEAVAAEAGLGVVHVTLHMALRDVFAHLTVEAIDTTIGHTAEVMTRLKGSPARVGVCALNPHGGENGLFGHEEQTCIAPAVERAAKRGLDVHGPFPADTLLARAREGQFDGVVAMYHDQGHIALKLLDMHAAVNVTLGLPIVRTSVAHGTAFDLAWQGRAEDRGLVHAVQVAARLAGRSKKVESSMEKVDQVHGT